MRNLYWNHQAFGETTQFEHIKKVRYVDPLYPGLMARWRCRDVANADMLSCLQHYTKSHKQINPHSITPVGPEPDILRLEEEMPAAKK